MLLFGKRFIEVRNVMRDDRKTMLIAIFSSLAMNLFLGSVQTAETVASNSSDASGFPEVVCYDTDIRNSLSYFKQLENCTIIDGHVRIILLERSQPLDFANISFPRLREITDYLLLYRVQHLKTLSGIFPNLSIIRGRHLFFNYALIVYEMLSLEDIGLSSLMLIERGAVHIERNPQLCYVETIDWNRVLNTELPSRFLQNKKSDECFYVYPQNIEGCSATTNIELSSGQTVDVPLCWNYDLCQKFCPSTCKGNACYEVSAAAAAVDEVDTKSTGVLTVQKCCHSECVGGCSGPTSADCFACKAVKHNGLCLSHCPPELFELHSWQCVSKTKCEQFPPIRHGPGIEKWSPWKTFEQDGKKFCIEECPSGFMENDANRHQCITCPGPCPKECVGLIVDNIQAAQKLKGCTVVNGVLEIQVTTGNVMELEKYLGEIQEVTHFVRVIDSYALTSLDFFKSLNRIRGKRLLNGHYALFVFRNNNLRDIWNLTLHQNLTIDNGTVLFLDNQRLCADKILKFLTAIGQFYSADDAEVTKTANGALAVCEVSNFAVMVKNITALTADVVWDKFPMNDTRYLISWVVNYKPVSDDTNITGPFVREVCGTDNWKSVDVDSKFNSVVLEYLQPFTNYVVFVQAYITSRVDRGIFSSIVPFTTHMSAPSSVRNIKFEAVSPSVLLLSWTQPSEPNGLMTHYIVKWSTITIDYEKFERKNYCGSRIHHKVHIKQQQMTSLDEATKSPSIDTFSNTSINKCCRCPKSLKSDEENDIYELNRKHDINFENHLHNAVFYKATYENSVIVVSTEHENISSAVPQPEESTEGLNFVSPTTFETESSVTPATKLQRLDGHNSVSSRRAQNWTVVVGNTSTVLDDLMHYQDYLIEIIACNGNHSSETYASYLCSQPAIMVARTKPNYSADTINEQNISVSQSMGATYLHWLPPSRPNALVIAFEIELSKVDIKDYKPDALCITYKDYRDRNGKDIREVLSPGNWSFRIRAISLAGNGSWTSMRHFFINGSDGVIGQMQHFLALLLIIPVLFVAFAVVVCHYVKWKRKSFLYPEVISFNPEYINPDDLYVADEWEVDRDHVTLLEPLGQGSFGMVYHGLFERSMPEGESLDVAIKTVTDSSTLRDRIAFLHEASVMKAFDSRHVVKLIGIVSKGQPSLVVMELMSNGDLKSFLRKHRPDDEASLASKDFQPLTLKQILQMAGEIADGMAYLSSRKFVHRDLAARNCMVSADQTVKIGDFGLTRDIYATEYYRKSSKGLLPVRWMAPESLKDGVFTSRSDVWSYGVVLWEMVTLATQPYQGLSNEEVLHYVIDGGKMTIPDGCPEKLMTLMTLCWNSRPDRRPAFDDIIEYLLPDLKQKAEFCELSYYFARKKGEIVDKMTEQEKHFVEEESEDNSRTPLNLSFPMEPASFGKPKKSEILTDGIFANHCQMQNGQLHRFKPVHSHIPGSNDSALLRDGTSFHLNQPFASKAKNGDNNAEVLPFLTT